MKTSFGLLALAALALAAPAPSPDFVTELTTRQSTSSATQNDVVNKKACKAVTVIFARGTTESGNVGSLAGPPFFTALASAIGSGNLALQGVDYPADIPGFLIGGSPAGASTMAQLVNTAISQCPDTKIVMSGYSQGGQVTHLAAAKLNAAATAKVSAVVIFGDPMKGKNVGTVPAANVLTVCHFGDNICSGGSMILLPHLTYSMDATTAANFVKGKTGY